MSANSTTLYAEVIGDPIAHSKSPIIHGFWLEQLGVDADYRRRHVTAAELEGYIAERRSDPAWRGCNVTMPHKQAMMELCDSLDPLAQRVAAVNTVVRQDDGSLKGYNTDVGGFLEPLCADLEETHLFRMARVLGTGGAARAIVVGLSDRGFVIVLAGRNPDKARALLDELGPDGEHHAVHLSHFAEPTNFAFDDRQGCLDLIINASPLGMRGQSELTFDWSHAPPGSIAYDIVTDPLETQFLSKAKNAGHKVLDGYSMLIGQADQAFEMFFGHKPPRDKDAQLRESMQS
ncbi:MAG: shikimate dehydrogenase [Erythrobacter sp.]